MRVTDDSSAVPVLRPGQRLTRARFLRASLGTAALSLLLGACSHAAPTPTSVPVLPTAIVPPTPVPTSTAATQGAASPAAAAQSAASPTPVASAANAVQQSAKEARIGYGTEQFPSGAGLDPQMHGGTINESRLRNIYECLVQFAPDLKTIQPQLATEWKRLDDLTMQFKLREGVTFHNGDPFDAEAVKYSIENILQPEIAAPLRTSYLSFKEVQIIDSHTVNIVTQKPDPLFLARLSGFTMTMVDPKWVNSTTATRTAFAKAGNGTGPYKVAQWDGVNHDLILEANDNWWGGKPAIKNARFKIITEEASRVSALLAGDIDVAQAMPPEEIAHIDANAGKSEARVAISNRIPFYFMDVSTHDPIFEQTDPKSVLRRQAINYASNVDEIIKTVLLGEGSRVATVLAPWTVGYDPNLKPYPYDPQKAKQLMAQAGDPNGFETAIYFIQGRYVDDAEVAQAIVQELGKVGIKVKPYLIDPTQSTSLNDGQKENGLILASWGNWMFDADNTFYPLFHSSAAQLCNAKKGCSNYTYQNPDFDKIVDAARYELDADKRQQLYNQAQQLLFDQAPALFMYQLHDIYGVNSQLDWQVRSDEMIWVKEMKWKS